MGKYMKKTTPRGKVAVTEVAQSSLGVRTRAKTLALHCLRNSAPPEEEDASGSCSYLQLRNRRLEKPPLLHDSFEENWTGQNPKLWSGSEGSVSLSCVDGENDGEKADESGNSDGDVGVEASFGENVLEVEGGERSTRESTPCNLMRDPEIIRTPGSTTRSSGLTGNSGRVQNSENREIPLASELDEFFTAAEKKLQNSFMDKYNFDPSTDKPLPGHFQWEKIDL